MANFIKANTEYIGTDTTAGAESITLLPVAGKNYQVANTGSGGNFYTVNYGGSSIELTDGSVAEIFYDGDIWIVNNTQGGGNSSLAQELSNPTYTQNAGIIIPLYIYPTDVRNNVDWNSIIALKKKYPTVPLIAIINPSNGPGSVVDGNYSVGIKRLQNANCKVIGYVSTDYTNNTIASVEADIDLWHTLYPEIQGIFFDEMTYDSTPANITYYKDADDYAKGRDFNITVGNPGSPFSMEYFDNDIFEIIIGWEDAVFPTLIQAQEDYEDGASEYNYLKRGLLLHGQASWDMALYKERVLPYYGWQYITDDDLVPNPWDSLSSYMDLLSRMIVGSNNQALLLPTGTEVERPIEPYDGMLRFNEDINEFEGYKNGAWGTVGGGQMLGVSSTKVISYNAQTIAEDIVVPDAINAYSVGDVTIDPTYTVTVGAGSIYKIL